MRLRLYLKHEGKDGGSITLGGRKLDSVNVTFELKKHPAIVTISKTGIPTLTGEYEKKQERSVLKHVVLKPSVKNVLPVAIFLTNKHAIEVTHADDPDEKLPLEEADAKKWWHAFVEAMIRDPDPVKSRTSAWNALKR